MAAVPGVKYDDGLSVLAPANCFPVRSLFRQGEEEDGGGAWLIAHRAEQRRRFKAVLCTKPKTYARIKEERRRTEKQGTKLTEQDFQEEDEEQDEAPVLDGFFLMRHCCVEDPSDLCSVNINGKEISEVKEEDLALFDNVAYVNAGENFLPVEAFRGFPIIRELEIPLNGIRGVKVNTADFPHLEILDLSYNNLSQEDVLTVGLLQNLKILHLTGNNFKTLPQNMAMPQFDPNSQREVLRYGKLEILLLDDNKLSDVSVFAALAGLSCLKHLNLEKNEIFYVPMLKSVEGKVVPNEDEKETRRLRRSAEKERRRSGKGKRVRPVTPGEEKRGRKEEPVQQPTPGPPPGSEHSADLKERSSEKEKTQTSEDLLAEDFTSTPQISDLDLDAAIGEDSKKTANSNGQNGSTLPPFPDLRLLNLAHNKITDEEALLAVAAWPMLVEILIHNNPLTTENSGNPPLLTRFLTDRLGIKITRKKEPEFVKPTVEIKKKKSRTVSSVVPKIPKPSVEELLMLEAPKPPSLPKPEPKSKSFTQSSLDLESKPLPPIPASPEWRSVSADAASGHYSPDFDEEEKPDIKLGAWGEDKPEQPQREGTDSEAFFMTQVDDQEEEKKAELKKEEKKQKRRKKKEKSKIDDRYKGYEILLDAEEDSSYEPPKDMQGSIKALKYALNHELIYRDPKARLDRISKPVEPYRKSEVPLGAPLKTRTEKIDDMLGHLKTRSTVEEAGLEEVLMTRDKGVRKRFPDADRLLHEIQRRYNTVRVNSMKEAREAKKLIQSSLQDIGSKPESVSSQRVKMEAF